MSFALRPSRIINESTNVMGLEITDLGLLAFVFFSTQSILFPFKWEILALPVAAVAAFLLVRLRLRNRRHTIRDWLVYYQVKWLQGGVFKV